MVVILVVGTIVMIGNGALYVNRPTQAAGQSPEKAVTEISDSALKDLPTPNLVLPSIPPNPPDIYAKAYIVLDSKTKYPLLEQNANLRVPVASTTKLMTALVVLDHLSLDKVVTVSSSAANVPGSNIDLYPHEKITVKDLLYAMFLNSANNAAHTLAQSVSSEDDFIKEMNAKAAMLGLHDTHFASPDGFNDDGYSTAHDMALLLQFDLANPTLRTMMGTYQYSITSADGSYRHDLTNSDRLIQTDSGYYMANAVGGKTGLSDGAGHCLVAGAVKKDGALVTVSILNTSWYTNSASAQEAYKALVWATQ